MEGDRKETLEYEIDLKVERKLCLELLSEYNSMVQEESKFDLERCEEDLNKMNLFYVKNTLERIKELISYRESAKIFEKIVKETEEHGTDWVKEKYLNIKGDE